MLERLIWEKDRAFLDDLVFRLHYEAAPDWDLGGECLSLFKDRRILEEYERFWSSRPDFRPGNLLELGIWDGASVVLWFERFRPQKHVAVDLQERADSPYFRRYVASRGLEERIRTYWHTDQADTTRLRAIVEREFSGPLDLVIDDASHLYRPTRASFETLFPLLRAGGYYVLEDWNWGHWPQHFGLGTPTLTRLVFDLVEIAGTSAEVIPEIVILNGFVVVRRGTEDLAAEAPFRLEDRICRRPRFWWANRALKRLLGSDGETP